MRLAYISVTLSTIPLLGTRPWSRETSPSRPRYIPKNGVLIFRFNGDPSLRYAPDASVYLVPNSAMCSDKVLIVCVLAHVAQRPARALHHLGAGEVRRHALEDQRNTPLPPYHLLHKAVVEC